MRVTERDRSALYCCVELLWTERDRSALYGCVELLSTAPEIHHPSHLLVPVVVAVLLRSA